MIQPFDQEKAVGETGFLVGDGIEHRPIDLVELGISPIVKPTKVLKL